MMRKRFLCATVAAIAQLGPAGSARAQGSLDELKPGDRVRVWTREPPLNGAELQVRSVAPRLLVVMTPRWADTMPRFPNAIARDALVRLDVQQGRSATPRYRRVAALGGLALGFGVGLTAGMIADSQPYGEGEGVMILAPFGMLAGGVVGLLIGQHGEAVWKRVAVP